MKLVCEANIDADFFLKSGSVVHADGAIKKMYDEDSEEYEDLCRLYESEIGYQREEDVKSFDMDMLEILGEKSKEIMKGTAEAFTNIFKESAKDDRVHGFVHLGTTMVKIQDVSAMNIRNFEIYLSKE